MKKKKQTFVIEFSSFTQPVYAVSEKIIIQEIKEEFYENETIFDIPVEENDFEKARIMTLENWLDSRTVKL